jgi:hypothetical protein
MSRLLGPYILILVSRKEVYKWRLIARVQDTQVIWNCLFPTFLAACELSYSMTLADRGITHAVI